MLSFGLLTALLSLSGTFRTSPPVVELFHPEPSIAFAEPGGQLFPAHASAVRLQMVSVDTVEVRVFARSLGLALPGNDPLEEILGAQGDTVPSRALWSRRYVRPRDSLAHWSVALDLAAISRSAKGPFLDVRVFAVPKAIRPAQNQSECDTLRLRKGFLISRLGLFASKVGSGEARVMALNLETGRPWPGVKLIVHDAQGTTLRSASTKATGEARLGLSDGVVVVGKVGSEQGRMRLDGSEGREDEVQGETWGEGHSRNFSKGLSRVFAYLMQGTFQPGDSLVLGAVVWPEPGAARERLRVRVVDAGRQVLDSSRLEVPPDGHLQLRMRLPTATSTGTAWIELEHGATRQTLAFKVEEVRAHRLQAHWEARLDTTGPSPRAIVRLTGQWLSGRPASGLIAKVQERWIERLARQQCGRLLDVRRDPVLTREKIPPREISLDESGAWEDTLVLPPGLVLHAQGGVSLDAEVFEGGGVGVKASHTARWNWGSVPDLRLRVERHRVTVTAGLWSSRCLPITGKPLRLVLKAPWFSPNVLDTTVTSGDSLVWSLERFPRQMAGGRPERPALELRLCHDSLRCVTKPVRLRWPDADRDDGVEFLPEGESPESKEVVEDAAQEPLRPGEPVRIAWLSNHAGLALVQVLQGPRELQRQWIPVRRGRMEWRSEVKPEWDPGVTVYLSEIRRRGTGDTSELLRQSSTTFLVRRPDRVFDLAVEPADSLRPVQTNRVRIVNRSRTAGSVVLSAIDQGILNIDRFQVVDPVGFLDEIEALDAQWWKGLGRFGWNWWCEESRLECRDQLFGAMGGIGSGDGGSRMAGFGAGGLGQSIPSRSRSPQEDTLRMRKQGMPVSWISPVLTLPAQGLWVDVPLPAYTGQVRLTAMGVSGHRLGMTQRQATVQSPLELKATLPRQMAPGDTARVEIRLLGAKPSARLHLKAAGSLSLISSQECRLELVLGDGVCHAQVVAGEEVGTGFLEAIATDGKDRMTLPVLVDVQAQRRFGRERRRAASLDGIVAFDLDRRFQDSGTSVHLELSTRGLLGLASRMQELLHYPHGCLEQTISKAYPQLFLEELTPGMKEVDRIQARIHIQEAIAKLASFKTADGLFSLWPGGKSSYPRGTLHAAQFLLDASQRGHDVPSELRAVFASIRYSTAFQTVGDRLEQQSFLARLGQVDLDALRKLEEGISASVQRWTFAQAWKAGAQKDRNSWSQQGKADTIATVHARLAGGEMTRTRDLDGALRSPIGDRARTLDAMLDLDWMPGRDSLVTALVDGLSSHGVLSTYETALSLRALSRWSRHVRGTRDTAATMRIDSLPWRSEKLVGGQASIELPGSSRRVEIRMPAVAGLKLDGLLTRSGILRADESIRDSGLALEIRWLQKGGEDSALPSVPLRGDFVARVSVRNLQPHAIPNAAFTLWLPGGWEARNPRLDSTLAKTHPLLAVDIRADRVVQHFDLKAGETRMLEIPLRAVIAGNWQGPEAWLEALYDGALQVRRAYGRVKVGTDP